MTSLYPVFLKLDGRVCVVVGGGPIGARKATDLSAAGARVRAVSPTFDAAWDDLCVEYRARAFVDDDVDGATLVIAATGDLVVDDAVRAAAARAGALVNVVDVPEKCDFYCGASVRRGPLHVVIGTDGQSPTVAKKARALVDDALPSTLGPIAAALGAKRAALLAAWPSFESRAALLQRFVDDAVVRAQAGTSADDVGQWIDDELLAAFPAE